MTSFEVRTSTLYFISQGNTSDFSNTKGHLLSDNHVKTDIFTHNNYSAAEVQPAASYLLRRDEAYIVVIPNSKKETIDPIASTGIDGDAKVVSDGTKSHINFPKMFSEYVGRKIDPKDIGKVLPWVHIAISNSKSLMKNIHHGVKPEFLQEYLNEFCYKFNRRYFGDKLFDRLMIASVACTSEFEHRIYNRNLSAGCG